MDEIYKSIPKENTGLIIDALRTKGYKLREISNYLNMNYNTACNKMKEAVERRDFEERRKRIVKF